MSALLSVLFCLSGASALVFELLWFRQAGLAFGNSVWASSLVLSAFMGGLALGNGLAAGYGDRVRSPLRAYAAAEVAIACTGVALVYLLPAIGSALGPWLRALIDTPSILNPLRLFAAFVLLLVPATAMGVTLPFLTRTLSESETDFGRVLGRLYGWNTLGATAGVVAAEALLVGRLGVRGSALAAAAINIGVAAVAVWLSQRMRVGAEGDRPARGERRQTGARRWLVAAFCCGFCLLALEVVWFRFLLLFVKGHSLALAVILGIVLVGIASGGLVASWWLRARPAAGQAAVSLAFLAGLFCVVSYAAFPLSLEPFSAAVVREPSTILRLGVPLMLPVSVVSGMLFTVLGAALRRALTTHTGTAGVLTLANTTGAALGSLAGGFLLLPLLGMERSVLLVAIVYAGIGLLLWPASPKPRRVPYAAAAACVVAFALFPFGLLETRLLRVSIARWLDGDARVVAVREGLAETIVYFQRLMWGRPLSHVMLTNSYSMSADGYGVRRYQKLYVYWPMAVHPNLRRALVIGYGVGNTTKAITDSESIERVDIVDLSRDILETSRLVYRDRTLPLDDPRVRVHIEDGRYFLQATDARFDLITGEPPPPGIAGVENLYTHEYFQLLYDRLAAGGIVTYWLPLSDLTDVSAKAILRAFCDAFEDCSLWNGSGTHLMMIGTRDAAGPVSEEQFRRQWQVPSVVAEMRRLGVEEPGQLGALFIGDAGYLRTLTSGAAPLVDDDPKLIEAPSSHPGAVERLIRELADVRAAMVRFERSPFVARLWPPRLLAESIPYFEFQDVINAHMYGPAPGRPQAVEDVHRILTISSLRAPVVWRLGSNADIQQLVATTPPGEQDNPLVQYHDGIRLLSERRYLEAADAFGRAEQLTEHVSPAGGASTGDNAFALRVYALCMAGRVAEAQELTRAPFAQFLEQQGLTPASATLPPFWLWMKQTFGLDPSGS